MSEHNDNGEQQDATDSAAGADAPDGVRTYRGRNLAELLPQIREELGPDAVIVRQRDGLTGGVGGFFQRRCVEVEVTTAPRLDVSVGGEDDDDADLRAATAPEPSTPASPAPAPAAAAGWPSADQFAELLTAARATPAEPPAAAATEPDAPAEPATTAEPAFVPTEPPALAELATPFEPPTSAAPAPAAPSEPAAAEPPLPAEPPVSAEPAAPAEPPVAAEPAAPAEPPAVAAEPPAPAPSEPAAAEPPAPAPSEPAAAEPPAPAPSEPAAAEPVAAEEPPTLDEPADDADEPAAPAEPAQPARRKRGRGARTMQRVLVAQGLEPDLVAGLVAEAATHVAPFVDGGVEAAVGRTLARRLAGAPPTRPDPLVIAVVGGAGAGKTTCATRLASAYAARSDVQVIRLALGESEPAPGFTAVDAEGAVAQTAAATPGTVVVLDTPPVSASDAEGAAALTAALRAAGANETHVVLPATLSTPAARAALAAVAGLGPVAAILTHLDGTEHPGPALGALLTAGLPISYAAAGNPKDAFGLRAADHDALAAGLLA